MQEAIASLSAVADSGKEEEQARVLLASLSLSVELARRLTSNDDGSVDSISKALLLFGEGRNICSTALSATYMTATD